MKSRTSFLEAVLRGRLVGRSAAGMTCCGRSYSEAEVATGHATAVSAEGDSIKSDAYAALCKSVGSS
jgi:hypothetical protein